MAVDDLPGRSPTSSGDPAPPLSVILVATAEYALVRDAIRNFGDQREVPIELVLVGPRALERSITATDRDDLGRFARWRHVAVPDDTPFDAARAAGVRAATARVVAFTEDHSFPRAGWAAALLRAIDDGAAVVGPVVENGNPRSRVSWANFLLEYGEWMPPGRRAGHAHLPGHNSAYRRDVLLAQGDRLTSLLESESVLHWQLAREGHRLVQEPGARTRHVNFSRLGASLALRYHLGRRFAASRCGEWSRVRRFAYAAAFPAIALVRAVRVGRLGAGTSDRTQVLASLPLVTGLVLVASLGEAVGNITGTAGSSAGYLSDIEHDRRRFTSAGDVRQALRAG